MTLQQSLCKPLLRPADPHYLRRRGGVVRVLARQQRRPGLLDAVLQLPRRVEDYFERSFLRKVLWSGISYAGGYYASNVVSLSFGALAINDVLAAALTVVFYEVVTHTFYEAEEKTLRLYFLNFFKLGVVTGLLADAIKLGG